MTDHDEKPLTQAEYDAGVARDAEEAMADYIKRGVAPAISSYLAQSCCQHHRTITTRAIAMSLVRYAAHLAALSGEPSSEIKRATRHAIIAAEGIRGGLATVRQAIDEAGAANVVAETGTVN